MEGSESDPKLLAFVNSSQLNGSQIKKQKHSLNILLRQNKAKTVFNLRNVYYYSLSKASKFIHLRTCQDQDLCNSTCFIAVLELMVCKLRNLGSPL